jgi:acetyl esterase/lipase
MIARALVLVLLAVPLRASSEGRYGGQAPQAALPKKTYVFKEVDGVKVELDVHRPDTTDVLPIVAWIHGGALIMGNRQGVPRNLLDLCRTEGFALVSIDYRLAPQSKVPQIIDDVKDAFAWIRGKGAEIAHLDPKKLVVAGGSAGGYLTLMTGVAVEPRPVALVAYWGYGDVDGDWYTKPSEHYRKTVQNYTREEALRGMAEGVVTGPADKAQGEARQRYYHYLRQNGLWTLEVTGFKPGEEKAKLDPFCPVRNVTPAWPPTMLVHGTEDTDVPYELSAAMAKEFERQKISHELVTVPGAGHGLSGGDKKLVADAHTRALEFIKKHLK